MVIQHVNRKGDTFYLHEGKSKTGKPKYFFSKKDEGALVEVIPAGYEIYENPDAQVFLRKQLPQTVTDEEVALVRAGLRRLARGRQCLVDVRGESIVIFYSEASRTFQKVLRFSLIDEDRRQYSVERWCFLGSIDDWIVLSGSGDELPKLVERYCPHIGRDSFYELM